MCNKLIPLHSQLVIFNKFGVNIWKLGKFWQDQRYVGKSLMCETESNNN